MQYVNYEGLSHYHKGLMDIVDRLFTDTCHKIVPIKGEVIDDICK